MIWLRAVDLFVLDCVGLLWVFVWVVLDVAGVFVRCVFWFVDCRWRLYGWLKVVLV